jgi:hypothetical protein
MAATNSMFKQAWRMGGWAWRHSGGVGDNVTGGLTRREQNDNWHMA